MKQRSSSSSWTRDHLTSGSPRQTAKVKRAWFIVHSVPPTRLPFKRQTRHGKSNTALVLPPVSSSQIRFLLADYPYSECLLELPHNSRATLLNLYSLMRVLLTDRGQTGFWGWHLRKQMHKVLLPLWISW